MKFLKLLTLLLCFVFINYSCSSDSDYPDTSDLGYFDKEIEKRGNCELFLQSCSICHDEIDEEEILDNVTSMNTYMSLNYGDPTIACSGCYMPAKAHVEFVGNCALIGWKAECDEGFSLCNGEPCSFEYFKECALQNGVCLGFIAPQNEVPCYREAFCAPAIQPQNGSFQLTGNNCFLTSTPPLWNVTLGGTFLTREWHRIMVGSVKNELFCCF